ncbi:MAG: ATP synthase F1 subunit gamma [Nitrospinota bacterium]|jgi:F-type H+-transporting ATPase subunit gamma|nr:ATP synthase F1 subunit gamma [Nitrospinota bacterium]MDP6619167.1 ATP synthase F1 subunit gamma [Nitrospinota bacterium]MDP7385958.1 ATP synthase F1 subunit gamma [Nitrospinota bacterium]
MASIQQIKRRITSVKSTEQITRAMKMVAAAKLRRAQERILAARPFADKLAEMIQSLARRAEHLSHPLMEERPVKRRLLVSITSDKGLCGSYNTNIVRVVAEKMSSRAEAQGDAPEVSLVSIGKKGRDVARHRGYPIQKEFIDNFGRMDYDLARTLGDYFIAEFTEGRADEVVLIYNRFISTLSQRVTVEMLLPISPPKAEDVEAEAGPAGVETDFLYEPSPEGVLEKLIDRHLYTHMHRVILDADASEHGARMTAMENASRNAKDMIGSLTLLYNRTRQAKITTELIEVVSGAEALAG